MIEKTEAIVLRVAPFSKTSHVVTWLTPGRGRLATVVKGACRPKSPFLGQYDLFYTCELLFYSRERQGLHIARECCPLDARPGFRTNWKASAIASYICDLVSRVTPEGQAQPESYRLVQSALDFLGAGNAKLQLMFWFELRLAEAAGLTPRLATCAACGAGLPDRGAASFSARRGGIPTRSRTRMPLTTPARLRAR